MIMLMMLVSSWNVCHGIYDHDFLVAFWRWSPLIQDWEDGFGSAGVFEMAENWCYLFSVNLYLLACI